MSDTVTRSQNESGDRAQTGWSIGFSNLLAKEFASWARTRSWWFQPLLWLAILVGPLALPLFAMREVFAAEGAGILAVAHEMFFGLAAIAPAVGAILLMQGSVIAERQLGTAAWVLSKPVARSAFLLSKLLAHGVSLLAAALVLPGAAAYLLLSLENSGALPLGPFVLGLGLAALNVTFYLVVTLSLGAISNNRVVVLAIPLAVLLGGDLVLGLLPGLAQVTPWLLGRLGGLVAQGGVAAGAAAAPSLATLAWCAVFVVAGLRVFDREDL